MNGAVTHSLDKEVTHLSPDQFIEYSRRHHRPPVGRSGLYEALRRGDIPHVRLGRRILIPINALDLMLQTPRRDDLE